MKQLLRLSGIGILVVLLVLVRLFEHQLFYDPFIDFYRYGGHLAMEVPPIHVPKLLLNVSLRYWLNTLISLVILFVAFRDRNIVKFAALLFALLFGISIATFSVLYFNLNSDNVMGLFYVRRFLIHPLFILILLPAFYYYRLKKRENP
ncbi:exosortase F system-associated protein [Salegentibacter sp. JZCK2]|uniref:exosortase F system-associated membrane protein n=1 Tax=Salegentibacter tibetensis TaxID=2873600 RepID=UPI001CCB4D8F|nr:exosortase F system-associated protein [Salegentibacter tibetensis]MBZ9730735.1 exosortase F system-associated protein [Salegentibacter tibetensis]